METFCERPPWLGVNRLSSEERPAWTRPSACRRYCLQSVARSREHVFTARLMETSLTDCLCEPPQALEIKLMLANASPDSDKDSDRTVVRIMRWSPKTRRVLLFTLNQTFNDLSEILFHISRCPLSTCHTCAGT